MIEHQSELGQFYERLKQNIRQGKDCLLQAVKTSVGVQSLLRDSYRYRYRMCVSDILERVKFDLKSVSDISCVLL